LGSEELDADAADTVVEEKVALVALDALVGEAVEVAPEPAELAPGPLVPGEPLHGGSEQHAPIPSATQQVSSG
jgi:hypothetical protein